MISVLRIVAVINAAIWFGAGVFFTLGVGPAFFSEPMLRLLPRPFAGAAAMIVLERYFLLHLICGGVALAHLVAESLYLSRPFMRWTLALVGGIVVLALVSGFGIQTRLQTLHRTMYGTDVPEAARASASRSFKAWHGTSQALNLVLLGGVLVYLLHVTRLGDGSRYR